MCCFGKAISMGAGVTDSGTKVCVTVCGAEVGVSARGAEFGGPAADDGRMGTNAARGELGEGTGLGVGGCSGGGVGKTMIGLLITMGGAAPAGGGQGTQ
jgi:hypothetical protein